tara:strand:- start:2568 stop:2981 length:414 start_codon:yes stop_codon:yes gene_type:complete
MDQLKPAEPAAWQAICDDFRKMMATALLSQPLPIQREDEVGGQPLVDSKYIIFNGIGNNGHETMVLQRDGEGFQFCKTAHKPYDRAVTALLILADFHSPNTWLVKSDGAPDDWQEGLELARTVQPECNLPSGITSFI